MSGRKWRRMGKESGSRAEHEKHNSANELSAMVATRIGYQFWHLDGKLTEDIKIFWPAYMLPGIWKHVNAEMKKPQTPSRTLLSK